MLIQSGHTKCDGRRPVNVLGQAMYQRLSLLLKLVLMLSPTETQAIFGRPLENLAQSRRNYVSANKKTENISRH